jgi:hypothetical protein
VGTPSISGIVKFVEGGHASSLIRVSSEDVTVEMQREVANYFGSNGTAIVITNEAVVAN